MSSELNDAQIRSLRLMADPARVGIIAKTDEGRKRLKRLGCMGLAQFTGGPRGYWRITPAGREALTRVIPVTVTPGE